MSTEPRIRILVADPDERVRALFKAILSGNRFDVLEAATRASLEVLTSQWKPHLVLIDAQLAGTDLDQLCQQVRSEAATQASRIVLFATTQNESYQQRVCLSGIDEYLVKPFRLREMLLCVQRLTNHLLPSVPGSRGSPSQQP
jgi:DNA-binding response OmpR family regulator